MRKLEVEKVSLDLKIAELRMRQTVLDLVFEIKKNFYEIIFLREKEKLTDEKIASLKEMLDLVKKRGHSQKSELTEARIKMELFSAQDGKEEIQNRIKRLKIALNNTLAGKLEENFALIGKLKIPEQSFFLESLIQEAKKANPLIAQKRLAAEQAKMGKSLEGLNSQPSISPGLSYSKESDKDTISLSADISLPSTKNKKEKFNLSDNLYEAALLDAKLMERRIETLLKQEYETFLMLKAKAEGFGARLDESKKVFSLTKILYQQGNVGLFDLLDAYKVYWNTRQDYIKLLFNMEISKARIEKLTGKIR
jgi:outer membrane protein TolC